MTSNEARPSVNDLDGDSAQVVPLPRQDMVRLETPGALKGSGSTYYAPAQARALAAALLKAADEAEEGR